jgi:hypothetical protein
MPDKIRIRLLTYASGPHFQFAPGLHTLDRELAEAWISTGHAQRVEEPQAGPSPTGSDSTAPSGSGTVETATAAPQRSQEADDQVAAERAGRAAAEAREERRNPYDGRSALGRAWVRGYDSFGQEYRVQKQA